MRTCERANVRTNANVEENVRTASLMVRKSQVEIVICCGGGTKELDAAASVGAVLLVGGPENTEGS